MNCFKPIQDSDDDLEAGGDGISVVAGVTPASKKRTGAEVTPSPPSPPEGVGARRRKLEHSLDAVAGDAAPKESKGKQEKPKMTFTCTGCGKPGCQDDQVPGFLYHRTCKRAYDSLARLAVKQSEETWWNETKSNPKRLQKALRDFTSAVPTGQGRGKNKNQSKWKIATYKESVRATTMVEKRDIGRMMWKEQYLRWAESVEGGFMSRTEAEMNWTEWSAKADRKELTFDHRGPKQATLRLQIVVDTLVDDVYQYAHEH